LHMEAVKLFYGKSNGNYDDDAATKLELMGYSTGYRLVERLSRETLRHSNELEVLKYVCKVVWNAIYKKEVNSLRTNNLGLYVLLDDNFRFISSMAKGTQYLEQAPKYLSLACGIVRGALANLGVTCVVTAEVTQLPQCKFEVQVQRP